MKRSRQCPKCGSTDILKIRGGNGAKGSGNNIPLGLFGSINVNRFLCCTCGFSEEWVETSDLPKLKNKMRK
jgi:ribosomal protein S27AE